MFNVLHVVLGQVFWTFFSVLGGGVYFKEFETLRAFEIVGFATGVMVVSSHGLFRRTGGRW